MRRDTFSRRFASKADGSGTIMSLFFLVTIALIAGIAIDGANGWRSRDRLQIAADSAALVAAAHVDDLATARSLAKEAASRNLHGDETVVTDTDIVFGTWDEETDRFVALSEDEAAETPYEVVQVTAQRTAARANTVGTYLLRLAGVSEFEMNAMSYAVSTSKPATSSGVDPKACSAGTFISTGSIAAGGGNSFDGDVCFYGADRVSFGGNDYFSEDVRVMADDIDTIAIYSPRPDSAPIEDIKVEGQLEPVFLPKMDSLFNERWNAFYGHAGESYGGDLVPDFVKDPATGTAKIVQYDGWWSIKRNQIEPYTIYVVNGGAQFGGNLDAHNVMFMVNGYFGTGGGHNLQFYDVYIFGTQIGLAGNVQWGDPEIVCNEKRYSVYLMAKNSISMGGWGNQTRIDGIVVAAPTIQPGGGLLGTHIYMESSNNFNIGGAWDVSECSVDRLSSYWRLPGVNNTSPSSRYHSAKLKQ